MQVNESKGKMSLQAHFLTVKNKLTLPEIHGIIYIYT